jgi:3-deoxy-D-manno-octulosonic-acid transferase
MFIYNLVVRLYGLAIALSSLSKTKAKQWIAGRKNWRESLSAQLDAIGEGKRVWIHCASYGEFEQGRPLIEALIKKNPGDKIILTFFSPSGYESFKNWPGAAVVSYLPLDTEKNAADFIRILNPGAAIFIKYEFWLNILSELKKKDIPTFLVSAVFKEHHPFFRPYGGIFRRSLKTFQKLFVQDEGSARLLKKIGVNNVEVCGDTRFDRVMEIRNKFSPIQEIEKFKGQKQVIVAGSTWPGDEELVLQAYMKIKNDHTRLIIVPHDVELSFIKSTIEKLEKLKLTYSLYSQKTDPGTEVLVIDVIGILSRVYNYGMCAYIGGGFNGGLHNTLEAAVYNIPVTFYGEDYNKFNEAVDLLKLGAATHVKNSDELASAFKHYLTDKKDIEEIQRRLDSFFQLNSNVTSRIIGSIHY